MILKNTALDRMIQLRRALHQIPETGLNTIKTQQLLKDLSQDLYALQLEPIPHSLILFFDFQADSAIALRADMDALALEEKTGLPFASQNGCMHACGHDGHTAMLFEAARYLSQLKEEGIQLDANFLLIFQPAEEGPGGARPIVETGLFRKYSVQEIYGMHIFPELQAGKLVTRSGPMMAGASDLIVTFQGKAAHQATPQAGINALHGAAVFISQTLMETLDLRQETNSVLGYGTCQSEGAFNIIPAYCQLTGTIRYYEPEVFEKIYQVLENCARQLEIRTGLKIQLEITTHYPPVINDQRLSQILHDQFDVGYHRNQEMIAEDFAFYQRETPGVFLFIGSGCPQPLHAADFAFDEDIMADGFRFYQSLIDSRRIKAM